MKTLFTIKKSILATLAVVSISMASPAVLAEQSTFDDFGGKEGLTTLMDDFMVGLVADPRTADFFKNSNQERVKVMLVLQICELLDGGCKYPGKDMKQAHVGMQVNRAGFNGLVEVFQVAMDQHNIPYTSQNKLLAKLAPMYRDIERTTGDAIPPKYGQNE